MGNVTAKLGADTEERLQLAEEISKGYFRQGLNCAEAVLKTYMDIYDTGFSDDVVALATGFGGGMGHTRMGVCGAISGALMALGMAEGRRDPMEGDDPAERIHKLQQELYPKFGALVNDAKNIGGTLICGDMTAQFDDFGCKTRKLYCRDLIVECARLAVRHTDGEIA